MRDPDSPSPTVRVLVAEDDPISRRALASLLQRHRYEVELVADGQDALDILLGVNAPSVVLLDWDMPRLDGLRVARAVRSIPTERYTYLIMVTACDSAEDLLNAFASGVDDFLSKPVSIPQMLARLRGAKRVLALEERLAARDAELERTLDEVKALKQPRPPHQPSQGLASRRLLAGG
jgi:CheY-like chemotaxis protein